MDRPLRYSAFSVPPYFHLETEGNRTVFKGPFDIVANVLNKIMNRSYEILDAGTEMGRELTPGNWSGALGMVINEEADIFITPCTASPEMESLMLFSTVFDESRFGILSGLPLKVGERGNFIFASIGFETQVCFFISWLLVSVSYYFAKIESNGSLEYRTIELSFLETLLALYGLLFKVGVPHPARRIGRRMILASWLICTFFLTTLLSTVLYSKLAVTDVPERINSVKDLIKHPKIKPLIIKSMILDSYLQASTSPDLIALWKQILSTDSFIEFPKFFHPTVMDDIYESRAVALANPDYVFNAMVGLDCQKAQRFFYIAKEMVLKTTMAFCYRKGLQPDVVEALNQGGVLVGGMGYLQAIREQFSRNSFHCLDNGVASRTRLIQPSMGFKELKQAFVMLCIGWAISLFAFLLEWLILVTDKTIIPAYRSP